MLDFEALDKVDWQQVNVVDLLKFLKDIRDELVKLRIEVDRHALILTALRVFNRKFRGGDDLCQSIENH